jgi:hypothetical protein
MTSAHVSIMRNMCRCSGETRVGCAALVKRLMCSRRLCDHRSIPNTNAPFAAESSQGNPTISERRLIATGAFHLTPSTLLSSPHRSYRNAHVLDGNDNSYVNWMLHRYTRHLSFEHGSLMVYFLCHPLTHLAQYEWIISTPHGGVRACRKRSRNR